MSEITVTFNSDEALIVRLALSAFAADRRLSARSYGSAPGFEEAESRAQAEESTANAAYERMWDAERPQRSSFHS
jgi:hypothetical protein